MKSDQKCSVGSAEERIKALKKLFDLHCRMLVNCNVMMVTKFVKWYMCTRGLVVIFFTRLNLSNDLSYFPSIVTERSLWNYPALKNPFPMLALIPIKIKQI